MLMLLATKVQVEGHEPKKKRTGITAHPRRAHGALCAARLSARQNTAGSWDDSDNYPNNGACDEERDHP